ncbi:hypothetical protein OH77DRAFT_1493124 [Trametes cingulata]|nr:hypothetical protein OH77DRAFT_1493124 [Trametes cingulata]
MAQLSLDDTLGAVFLGNIAAACFYGITVVQTWMYYGRGGGDRLYLQCLVFLLCLHLALVTHTVYTYAVKDFANFLALEVPICDLIVRGIFCERVWKRTNWILIATIDILYISLGAGVVADILIAAAMCVLLVQRRTGFSSLCALLCLISYATMPSNFVFIAFYFVLPKLFLNSLLATLNARRPLREASASMVSIPLSVTTTPPMSESVSRPPRRYSMRPRAEEVGCAMLDHLGAMLKARQKYWEDLLAKGEEPVAITV